MPLRQFNSRATATRPAAGDEPVDVVVPAIQIEQFGAEACTP
jgi:hypothetical protein